MQCFTEIGVAHILHFRVWNKYAWCGSYFPGILNYGSELTFDGDASFYNRVLRYERHGK